MLPMGKRLSSWWEGSKVPDWREQASWWEGRKLPDGKGASFLMGSEQGS